MLTENNPGLEENWVLVPNEAEKIDIGLGHVVNSDTWHAVKEILEETEGQGTDWVMVSSYQRLPRYQPERKPDASPQEIPRYFTPWTLPYPKNTTSYLERYVNHVVQNNPQEKQDKNRVRFT